MFFADMFYAAYWFRQCQGPVLLFSNRIRCSTGAPPPAVQEFAFGLGGLESPSERGGSRCFDAGPPWDGFFGLALLLCRGVDRDPCGSQPSGGALPRGPIGEGPSWDAMSEDASGGAGPLALHAGAHAEARVGEKVLDVSVKGYFGCIGVQSWFPGFAAAVDASIEHQMRCMSTLMLSIARFFKGWRVAGLQGVKERAFF